MQSSTWYQWFIDQPWTIEVSLAALVLFLIQVVLKRALLKIQSQAKLKENDWRYHLDYAALTPARVFLWLLLISVIVDLLIRQFDLDGVFCYFTPLRNAAIVCCMTWFLLRWKKVIHIVSTNQSSRKALKHLAIDSFTLEVLGKIFTVLILFLTLLTVMQIFGLDVLPLITFGGIGAATIGFAGKDAISNFFGGLMIYLTRPFIINDLIELPDRKILGNVEEIGWYFTSIRDSQKKPIYIPNSVFSTVAVINQSRITHRRIEESIGIRLSDITKLPSIIAKIYALFEQHNSIDHNQAIHVFLEKFGDYTLQIEIKAYSLKLRYEDFMKTRQEILIQIYGFITEAGAEMPNPTMDIHLKNLSETISQQ
jgi:MscS family membrane protein